MAGIEVAKGEGMDNTAAEAKIHVYPLVMPPECADLIRFLCAVWKDIDALRHKAYAMGAEEMKNYLIDHWPVIQGTRNQINLIRIGEQPYNSGNIAKAVSYMLEA